MYKLVHGTLFSQNRKKNKRVYCTQIEMTAHYISEDKKGQMHNMNSNCSDCIHGLPLKEIKKLGEIGRASCRERVSIAV